MTVTYICASCGAHFYFHGSRGQVLQDLINVYNQILKEFHFEIPLPWNVVEHNAKCCKSPFLYRHITRRLR